MAERPKRQVDNARKGKAKVSSGNARNAGTRRRKGSGADANRRRRSRGGRQDNISLRGSWSQTNVQRRSLDEVAAFAELGLSERVLAAVCDMGYEEPTEIQKQAIPAVLEGADVMGAAQTGTGKTCAFVLPLLDKIAPSTDASGARILVVTPTRELAAQISEVAENVSAHTHHRVLTIVGGVSYEGQRRGLKAGTDVLVATPGRLIDLIREGVLDLSGVEALVLDEADRMLDMGFLPQVREIVEKVPSKRQTLLFSATLSSDVLQNMGDVVTDPVRVEVAPKGTAAETVTQYVLGVSPEAKKRILVEVLRREGSERVIVFCRGKHRADHMSHILQKKGFSSAPIHGDRTQNQRMRALERFSSGEVNILVATDVLARGIDVGGVSYVVNFDVPNEAEAYIHRIGRTGRAGEQGWALTFVSTKEYDDLRAIETLMDVVIDTYPRAEGLDLGDAPATLDPDRGMPGKKERRPQTKKRRRSKAATKHATAQKEPAAVGAAQGKDEAKAPDGPSAADAQSSPREKKTQGTRQNARRSGTPRQFRRKSQSAGKTSREAAGKRSNTRGRGKPAVSQRRQANDAGRGKDGGKPRRGVRGGQRRGRHPGDLGGSRNR